MLQTFFVLTYFISLFTVYSPGKCHTEKHRQHLPEVQSHMQARIERRRRKG